MKTPTIHKRDAILNRINFYSIMETRGIDCIDLHKKMQEKYGLDISYKGFMNLISNRSAWKYIYVRAMTDILAVNDKDIFDIVDVNVERKLKQKAEWKEKYEEAEAPWYKQD